MANKIIHKRSSVAAKVPLASDLDYGELAVNYTDAALYLKKADNSIARVNDAANVKNTPAGNIAATTVQAALNELDTEKQAALVSGTTIKTINSTSLLGSGDIVITGGGSAGKSFFMAGW
jgi:hypothetical protein